MLYPFKINYLLDSLTCTRIFLFDCELALIFILSFLFVIRRHGHCDEIESTIESAQPPAITLFISSTRTSSPNGPIITRRPVIISQPYPPPFASTACVAGSCRWNWSPGIQNQRHRFLGGAHAERKNRSWRGNGRIDNKEWERREERRNWGRQRGLLKKVKSIWTVCEEQGVAMATQNGHTSVHVSDTQTWERNKKYTVSLWKMKNPWWKENSVQNNTVLQAVRSWTKSNVHCFQVISAILQRKEEEEENKKSFSKEFRCTFASHGGKTNIYIIDKSEEQTCTVLYLLVAFQLQDILCKYDVVAASTVTILVIDVFSHQYTLYTLGPSLLAVTLLLKDECPHGAGWMYNCIITLDIHVD